MSNWTKNKRWDKLDENGKNVIEDVCEHGIGHELGIHGCDGCCAEIYPRPEPKEDWEEEFELFWNTPFGRRAMKSFISSLLQKERAKGEAEGAKRMTAKIRGVLMAYPDELHDEISVVLHDYLKQIIGITDAK